VVSLGPERSFVIADIPGIIEGAAEGAGLGLRFLRHLERTRVLLHILAPDPEPSRHPLTDFAALQEELGRFDAELAQRPMVVVLGKMDLPDAQAVLDETREALEAQGHALLSMSAATTEGVDAVLQALEARLTELSEEAAPSPAPSPLRAEQRPHGDATGFPEPPPEDD